MRTTTALFFVLATASLAAGCGGSPGLAPSAAPDTRLSELTGESLANFCQEVSTFVTDWSARPELSQGQCRYTSAVGAAWSGAVTDAQLQGDCARRYTTCTALGGSSIATPPRCRFPATCTATVAHYTACLDDITAALDQLADAAPACGDLQLAGGTALPTFTLPASCKAYNALCPAVPIGPTPGAAAGVFELRD